MGACLYEAQQAYLKITKITKNSIHIMYTKDNKIKILPNAIWLNLKAHPIKQRMFGILQLIHLFDVSDEYSINSIANRIRYLNCKIDEEDWLADLRHYCRGCLSFILISHDEYDNKNLQEYCTSFDLVKPDNYIPTDIEFAMTRATFIIDKLLNHQFFDCEKPGIQYYQYRCHSNFK